MGSLSVAVFCNKTLTLNTYREFRSTRTLEQYTGRKITESLRNVTGRGGKYGKSKRGARLSTV
jgi:hypothetical protein